MFDFFLDKALILADQSGFKPGDSCINQLLSIPHNIYKSFDDGYEGVKLKHELRSNPRVTSLNPRATS